MKNTSLFCALVLCATFFACKKATKHTTIHFLTASVDGVTIITATGSYLTAGKTTAASSPDYTIEIMGETTEGASIALAVPLFSGLTGVYTFSDTINTATSMFATGYYVPSGAAARKASAHGQLILSAASPFLVGTFTFTCDDSTKVTGSFNAIAP